MERHRCKLCYRSFANGRALGGHMKAHLATLPLPPKARQLTEPLPLASSSSYSSAEEAEEEVVEVEVEVEVGVDEDQQGGDAEAEEKALGYGLRENPKKSFRLADPEFSFAVEVDAGSVIQDRESETESRNPTRRRSKRNRRPVAAEIQKQNTELRKTKLRRPSWVEASAEPEVEPVSSVSDTSPEEDVAMCLMMLSRDVWMRKKEEEDEDESMRRSKNTNDIKLKKVGAKHRCEKCNKVFRSHQAMCGHKKICYDANKAEKIFECPYCFKVFGSGQALGGHKRSHQLNSGNGNGITNAVKLREACIDLNLPAPLEEDDFSVLSDA